MEQWGAALNTVARAIHELQTEGLVETFHGVGSFVQAAEPAVGDDPAREIEHLRARVEHLEAQMMEVLSNLGLQRPAAPRSAGEAREAM